MRTKWIIGIVGGIVLIGMSAAIGSPPVATSIPTSLTEVTVTLALSVHTKGDIDCDGDADAVDALAILRHVVALPVNLPADCPPIGSSPPTPTKGDIDCDGDADAVDALAILRHVVALPVNLPADCPPIGSSPPDSHRRLPQPTPTPTPTPTQSPGTGAERYGQAGQARRGAHSDQFLGPAAPGSSSRRRARPGTSSPTITSSKVTYRSASQ